MINKAHIKIGDVIYGSSDSVDIIYDNTESGLESNNIQDAIDEIAAGACFADGIVVNVEMANWIAQEDGTYTNTVAIEGILESEMYDVSLYGDSTEEQAHAFDFLVTDIDTYDGQIVLTASEEITVAFSVILRGKINLENKNVYVSDLSATNIEYDNSESNMVATDIQNAIDELATSVKGIVVSVTTDSWDLQEDGTYKKIIPVEQITGKETLDVCLYPGDIHTEEQVVAFSELITSIETGEGRITLTSTEAITVQFRIFLYGKINFENSYVVFKDCSAADIVFDDTVAKLGVKNIQEADVALALRPVNNNILINSNFANPVNQRGATSKDIGADKSYTIDRWVCLKYLGMNITDNYIELTRASDADDISFFQIIEEPLLGKTLTFSAKLYGIDDIISVTGTIPTTHPSSDNKIIETPYVNGLSLSLLINTDGFVYVRFIVQKNTTVKLEWAKLELGEHATPYVQRSYGEEFMRCQRYYQPLVLDSATLLKVDTNLMLFGTNYMTRMRVAPTPTFRDGTTVAINSVPLTAGTFAIEKNSITQTYIKVMATKNSHGYTSAKVPTIYGVVFLDAEL